MSKRQDRSDITTIQLPRDIRAAIKRKKRGDETYADFFKRRFGL